MKEVRFAQILTVSKKPSPHHKVASASSQLMNDESFSEDMAGVGGDTPGNESGQ